MELQFVKELMDNIFNNPVRQIWKPIQELLVLFRELWQPKVHFFLARRLFWGVLPKLYKYITYSFDMCQKLFYLKAYVFTFWLFLFVQILFDSYLGLAKMSWLKSLSGCSMSLSSLLQINSSCLALYFKEFQGFINWIV